MQLERHRDVIDPPVADLRRLFTPGQSLHLQLAARDEQPADGDRPGVGLVVQVQQRIRNHSHVLLDTESTQRVSLTSTGIRLPAVVVMLRPCALRVVVRVY